MNNPIISVVMPVYNTETYVGEAIASVLAQTFEDFELIIVDDGGSDASMSICREFTDARIRIVSQENRGLAGARNTGIAASRGQYIALLDSDDRWDPSKLALHFIHLSASPEVDVSYAGSRLIDAAGNPLRVEQRPRLKNVRAHHILTRNPVGNGSAAVIRRTALDRVAFVHPRERTRLCWFDESFRQSEDIELWIRMAGGYSCRFEGIEGLLTDYRIIDGGLSANVIRQYESWQRAVKKAQRYAPRLLARHGRRAAAYQLRYLARRAIQLGDGAFAVSLVRQALSTSPMIVIQEPTKTLVTIVASLAARWLPTPVFMTLVNRRLQPGVQA